MIDRLCAVCFRQHPPPGEVKCDDCAPGRQAAATRSAPPKPPLDLPEDLSGYNPEDFL